MQTKVFDSDPKTGLPAIIRSCKELAPLCLTIISEYHLILLNSGLTYDLKVVHHRISTSRDFF